VHCFDAKTGEKVFKQRLPSGRGVVSSPLATDSGLYVVNYDGVTTVLEPGPELKVAASNPIDDLCWACPAVIGDRLVIRGASAVYCIGQK
jgi:outer membrane protein assembly factor BamB